MEIEISSSMHLMYVSEIQQEMYDSAQRRGTGIAKRSIEYLSKKITEGNAVVATDKGKWVGFCYIETWSHGQFVANSGLIVSPEFRHLGVATLIKDKVFALSRKKYPNAKIFGLTTGLAVMKINSDLGYKPVIYSELTQDEEFWNGCKSCNGKTVFAQQCFSFPIIQKTALKIISLKTDTIMSKKVVLAFSGGLDTSYCAKYLSETLGYDVYAVTVNTGGFSKDEEKELEKKALNLGVKKYRCVDAQEDYYNSCVKYLIFGNVLKNNTYPLSVSAERTIQAQEIAKYAIEIGADAIAHGSTGAGNDQVMCPKVEIITPIRDMALSREEEIEFLKCHGYEMEFQKAQYSVNKGLWGTSVGGKETLTSRNYLPEEAFPSQIKENQPSELEIEFKNGEIISVNGESFEHPVYAIQKIEELASAYGIGRDIHVGDTIVGIKGRVGFEAAAASVIIKAHHLLEKHTLSKYQQMMKSQLSDWYGNWLHEALFLDPVMRNIESFLVDSQKTVSGKVFVTLHPYRFILNGIESQHDLMSDKFGSYGEANRAWTGEDVKGYTKIVSNSLNIYHQINK
ncbi:hypothetical protein Lal_00009644 [Lupinus albus]|nr:hypothetical protein Lal_00009644 [Lupinus albus]